MAFHLGAAFADLALFHVELGGLEGEAFGVGADGAGAGIDLGLPLFEAGFALGQGLLHFRDLRLPVDELLPEGGDGEAVLVARAVQAGELLADLVGLRLDLTAQRFERLVFLTSVSVDFGEVLAEPATGLGELVGGCVGLPLQFGQLLPKLEQFAGGGRRVSAGLLHRLRRGEPVHLERVPVGTQRLALGGHGPAHLLELARRFLQALILNGQLGLARLQSPRLLGQLLGAFRPGAFEFRGLGGQLGLPGLERGHRVGVLGRLLGQGLLPGGQLLGPAAELLLQRRSCLFGPVQGRAALAEPLPLGVELLAQLGELAGPRLDQRGLLSVPGVARVAVGQPALQFRLFAGEPVLELAHTGDRRFQGGAALVELPALLLVYAPLVVDLGLDALGLVRTVLQVGFGGFLPRALFREQLGLVTDLLAHPFQPRAQGGEHGLLTFRRGGALGQLGALLVERRLAAGQFFRFGTQADVGLVEVPGLRFQLGEVCGQRAGATFHLALPVVQLLLPLVQPGGQPVEPDEVRLVLGLALFEGRALPGELPVARLQLGEPLRQGAVVLGTLPVEMLPFFLQGQALPGEPGDLFVEGGGPVFHLGASGGQVPGLRIDLPFVFLDFSGRAGDRFLQCRQPVAPLAIPLV